MLTSCELSQGMSPALDTSSSTYRRRCLGRLRLKRFHRLGIGHVEGLRLTTIGADLSTSSANLSCSGPQGDRAHDRQARLRWPLSMPDDAPATTVSAGGSEFEAWHYLACTLIGRWVNPRTLLEWTRTTLSSSTS